MIADAIARMLPRPRAAADPLDDFWYTPVGSVSSAGVVIRPDTALQVAAVFACVRVLSETFASLPCRVYERNGELKKQAIDNPLWETLHRQPNPWQTAFEWREMGMSHLCMRGNWFNRIVQRGTEPPYLIPLNPERVRIEQLNDGTLVYWYRGVDGIEQPLPQEAMFHVRGLSLDGLVGISVLEYARNAIGLSSAQETHGASQFRNGALPAFWIKRPKDAGRWSQEARVNFRSSWRAIHSGPENAGNPPILEDDMSLEQLGLTNEDSQWIESRGFQTVEICRFFRVPPHMVAELSRATFSNIEQQSMEFVTYTMVPWCTRFEQAADRDLLGDPKENFVKLVLDGLLRGDTATRYAAHQSSLTAGWKTVNEVRAVEDLDPMDGGDILRFPLNTAADKPPEVQPKKKLPDEPPPEEDDAEEDGGKEDDPTPKAFGVLLDDAAGRIVSAELRGLEARAEHAAKDRDRWREWLTGYYAKHGEYALKVLSPIASAMAIIGERATALRGEVTVMVSSHRKAIAESDNPAEIVAAWSADSALEKQFATQLKGAFHV